MLETSAARDCPTCGTDLDDIEDFRDYFTPPDVDPLSGFVEGALAHAGIDPVLAREGDRNWSFQAGGVQIKAWCCCSEHLNFTATLAEVGNTHYAPLFRYLLAPEHAPYSFDLYGRGVRLLHVLHMSDAFTPASHPALRERVAGYVAKVEAAAPVLLREYGCTPAPTDLQQRHEDTAPGQDGRRAP
jgi:hypothetical protein